MTVDSSGRIPKINVVKCQDVCDCTEAIIIVIVIVMAADDIMVA